MPAAGLYYGLSAFSQAMNGRGKKEVDKAALAGALTMFVRSERWQPHPNLKSFEAEVHTFTDFKKLNSRHSRTLKRKPLPPAAEDAVMSVYRDINTDRLRMQVFGRMEDVDQQQREEQQLAVGGSESGAEEGIEMRERYV